MKDLERLEDLKNEIEGKEMTLGEMDNIVKYMLSTPNSLFEDLIRCVENKSWSYLSYDFECNVIFKIIEEFDEDKMYEVDGGTLEYGNLMVEISELKIKVLKVEEI